MEANINTQDVGSKKPSLFGMITSPGVQFERMKTKSPVWGGFFLFLLMGTIFAAVAAYLSLINTPDLAKVLKDDTAGIVKGTTLGFGAIGGLVGTAFGLFVVAGFYKVIMMFMSNDTPYMKILSIYIYANVVFYIGSLLNVALGYILGGNGTDKYTSLGPLFEQGTIAHGIGSAFEVFNIWSLILTGLGLHIVAGLSKKQATILISIFFILSIGFSMLGGMFSGFGK
ncbi:YIP1 family protein [Bacillus paramycoides]|uniref:Yip1 family protein n=1 Tax=Bacillus paramycoides TaxID=2026194 RepID=UPI0022440CD1|nr:Yip1 family protein [Bacillus paramycoides]MCW9132825.1 YIP1 family protein [Bacillus paramycoides]